MPQYEYICHEDGEVITMLRSMAQADDPVVDPSGRDRTFVRRLSAIQIPPQAAPVTPPGSCPCGDPHGPCNP